MGYTYQEGLMDHVDDNLSKYNVNAKLQFKANDWLKFNFNNNATVNIIKRPMANQTIFYGTIADRYPTQVTQLPAERNNLPTWNEMLYMENTRYNQNRISDAMSISATITPLEGWDIVGEMKMRLDVENNDLEMGFPKTVLPNGTIQTITGNRQGYQYPGMTWRNTQCGS